MWEMSKQIKPWELATYIESSITISWVMRLLQFNLAIGSLVLMSKILMVSSLWVAHAKK